MKAEMFASNHARKSAARIQQALLLACALPLIAIVARAQDGPLPPPPLPLDPTPLVEMISSAERANLDDASGSKKRVEVLLRISDAHLDMALASIKNGDTRTAERELDIFNKATASAIKTVFEDARQRRSLTKKIEQRLFKQIKTLEVIERMFPAERAIFAEAAIKQAKQLRVQALNETFASGEILKDPNERKNPPPERDNFPLDPISPGPKFFVKTGAKPSSQIPGDYLTEEEDEMVRLAQKPDDRIKVFMKIADRRLSAITKTGDDAPADKKAQKKAEDEKRHWGELPKLEKYELLKHYTRAIDEAIAKLEDAHERNPKSSAIPKSLALLRDATERQLQILRALAPEMKDETEAAALKEAIAQAETANQGAREGLKSN